MMSDESSNLPQLYRQEIAARGFETDPAQAAAIERLEVLRQRLLAENAGGRWRAWWRRHARLPSVNGTRGIYLWGGVGRGKTWLMDLFFDRLPPQLRQRSHFHHFMSDVHAELRQIRHREAPLALVAQRLAARTRVLCFDELYVSDIADAMILGTLFDELLRRGVMLVMTSNVPPGELYRDGLQRSRFEPAIALLESRLEVLAVDSGVDYRLRQLRRRPIYIVGTPSQSAAAMRSLFEQLADRQADSNPELSIQGRSLRALRRSGDVVWFDFATLCEGPRSPIDYADIASEFHTVLLSDVPIFAAPTQDNAARRFIALIDEFYDRGVKLVLCAAAAPDELYRNERLQFEFRRTSSRLIEMQSEAYLARSRRL